MNKENEQRRIQGQEVPQVLVIVIAIVTTIIEAQENTQIAEGTGQMIGIKLIHVIEIKTIQEEAQEVETEISHQGNEETTETGITEVEETREASEATMLPGQDLDLITGIGGLPGLQGAICNPARIEMHTNSLQL